MVKEEKTQASRQRSVLAKIFTSTKLIVLAAALIMLGSAWTWWRYVQNNPTTVFWAMIDNSLSTSSLSRTVTQDDGLQRLEKVIEAQTGANHLVNSRSTIMQGDPVTTKVVTESVGTPSTDYVRYAEIETTQKSASGKDLDFSTIRNVWGKSAVQGSQTNGQLYNESVLGIIPFANFPAKQRNALVEKMRQSNAYTVQSSKAERNGLLGRPVYTYNVEVKPEAYISVLKEFAKELGLSQLEGVDPSQYKSSQSVVVQLRVDGWSRQLTQINYGEGVRIENISAHNSRKALMVPPKDTVSVNELQTRLQSIQ